MKKNHKLISLGAGAAIFAGVLAGGVAGAGASPLSIVTNSIGLTQASVGADARAAAQETYLQSLADNLGIDLATLKAALSKTSIAALQKAVTDGKVTQAEAGKIQAAIESGDNVLFGLGGGRGFGGHGGGHGGPRGGMHGATRAEIATFLRIDEATLQTEMAAGKSLATIATDHGKTRDQLKAFLTAELTTSLAERVAAGKLTQAEADAKLTEEVAELDARIDGTFAGKEMGGRGGHGMPPAATGTTTGS